MTSRGDRRVRSVTGLIGVVGAPGAIGVVVVALVLAGAGLVPVASASSGSGFPAWRILPAAPLGQPYTVASVWTGSQLLVAGRAATPDGVGYNVAAAYRPATDTWRALPAPPPFTGTSPGQARAVWTGREMLLWGAGLQAAYDPVTNHWRRLPALPTGSGQIGPGGHVLVWTGRQMIIWGGDSGTGADSGGAAYDPAANSWRRLPPAPLAARNAVGAWTGRELVVAGGHDLRGTVFSDAAAYDPATLVWRRLPPMPAPRASAVAVWDGSEVVLVGGVGPYAAYGPTPPYRDGVAYDPRSNRWRSLPAGDVGRVDHAATWTGQRLLVWGGRTVRGGTEVVPPHGTAYDPVRDRWSELPAAPLSGRTDPTVVWTGSSLLIWGGRSVPLGTFQPDGAVYTR